MHHPMHYSLDFGARARQIHALHNISCTWEGDLNSIEKHYKDCEVARVLSEEMTQHDVAEEDYADEVEKKDIRKVMYEFNAEGAGQLSLKIGDLVELLETSRSGWAAGRIVTSDGEVLGGEAGWFPATFLSSV